MEKCSWFLYKIRCSIFKTKMWRHFKICNAILELNEILCLNAKESVHSKFLNLFHKRLLTHSSTVQFFLSTSSYTTLLHQIWMTSAYRLFKLEADIILLASCWDFNAVIECWYLRMLTFTLWGQVLPHT